MHDTSCRRFPLIRMAACSDQRTNVLYLRPISCHVIQRRSHAQGRAPWSDGSDKCVRASRRRVEDNSPPSGTDLVVVTMRVCPSIRQHSRFVNAFLLLICDQCIGFSDLITSPHQIDRVSRLITIVHIAFIIFERRIEIPAIGAVDDAVWCVTSWRGGAMCARCPLAAHAVAQSPRDHPFLDLGRHYYFSRRLFLHIIYILIFK